MNERDQYLKDLKVVEGVILTVLASTDEPVSVSWIKGQLKIPLELVPSALLRLWENGEVEVSPDRLVRIPN